jgi:hypothetical protein
MEHGSRSDLAWIQGKRIDWATLAIAILLPVSKIHAVGQAKLLECLLELLLLVNCGMAILDSQGRLFGKISLLDIGAALVILLVIFGVFFYPGTSGSVAQIGAQRKPIEVDAIVRGLSVAEPQQLMTDIKATGKTNIIIRNQPYGSIGVKDIKPLPRTVAVSQPDGTVKAFNDPRPEMGYSADMLLTLGGNAEITDDGPVLGNNKIKIGTPIEVEGLTYRFNASIVEVRIPQ